MILSEEENRVLVEEVRGSYVPTNKYLYCASCGMIYAVSDDTEIYEGCCPCGGDLFYWLAEGYFPRNIKDCPERFEEQKMKRLNRLSEKELLNLSIENLSTLEGDLWAYYEDVKTVLKYKQLIG